MPRGGVEPPRLAAHDSESCVSTNSTTRASVEKGVTKDDFLPPRKLEVIREPGRALSGVAVLFGDPFERCFG